MPIDRKLSILADRLLVMQILNPAKDVARDAMLLFKLSGVAVCDDTADTELKPVLVFRLFLRTRVRARCPVGGWFLIDRVAGVKRMMRTE